MDSEQRTTPIVEAWLKGTSDTPYGTEMGVGRVKSRVRQTRQRGRWWPLPSFRRAPEQPPTDMRTDYQATRIPATNGHTPTVIGRTSSMLTPVKAITAGALVFAIGGVLLIAQPFDQQGGSVPGAATEVALPVQFTAHVSSTADCSSRDFEGVVDGVEQFRGTRCKTIVEDSSDPRFAGTWLLVVSEDGYPDQGGASTVWTYEYRVENAEGAWQSNPVSGIEFDEREMTVAPVFTGEDAYEGLTAIVEMSGRETDADGRSDADLRGAIFGGSPPPPSGFPATD